MHRHCVKSHQSSMQQALLKRRDAYLSPFILTATAAAVAVRRVVVVLVVLLLVLPALVAALVHL